MVAPKNQTAVMALAAAILLAPGARAEIDLYCYHENHYEWMGLGLYSDDCPTAVRNINAEFKPMPEVKCRDNIKTDWIVAENCKESIRTSCSADVTSSSPLIFFAFSVKNIFGPRGRALSLGASRETKLRTLRQSFEFCFRLRNNVVNSLPKFRV